MKAIILAAGFGTRLQKEIKEHPIYSKYTHLPKALIPINDKPLINYWTNKINLFSKLIKKTFIITNAKYHSEFENWATKNNFPKEDIISNGIDNNENRNGAIIDLLNCIEHFKIDDDLLIIASDTLFSNDFSLAEMIVEFQKSQKQETVVLCYKVSDEEVHKRGIIELNENKHVISFLEKPKPEETTSRLACPAVYIIPKKAVEIIKKTVKEKPKGKDSIGKVIEWTMQNIPANTIFIQKRFEIGDLQGYEKTGSVELLYKAPNLGVVGGKKLTKTLNFSEPFPTKRRKATGELNAYSLLWCLFK